MKQTMVWIIALGFMLATVPFAFAQSPTAFAPTNTALSLPPRTVETTPTDKPLTDTLPPTPFSTPFPTPSGNTPVILDVSARPLWDGEVFQITRVDIDWTAHTINAVAITVQNVTDERRRGLVWYLLAPPGTDEPWRSAVYTAAEQPIELAPDESTRLTFSAPPADLIGEVALSAWVHQFDSEGERQHSDGVVYDVPLMIGTDFFMSIEHIDYFPNADGSDLMFVTFKFRNDSDNIIETGYSFSIAAPDDLTPWLTGAFNLPFQSLLLPPRSTLTITSRSEVELPAGDFRVTGWLHESIEGTLQFHNSSVYPTILTIP